MLNLLNSCRRRPYTLFGVLVHHGHSLHAGHYVAFVRGPNGLWHQMDDASVSQVRFSVRILMLLTLWFAGQHQADDATDSQARCLLIVVLGHSSFPLGTERPSSPTAAHHALRKFL